MNTQHHTHTVAIYKGLLSLFVVMLCLIGSISIHVHAEAQEKTHRVFELFTSQGCSSCPPADALLSEIATYSKKHEIPVSVLSYHVDYWNYLGWKDPYSSAETTAYQRAYARAFHLRSVYTPQLIVQGKKEFTGSDRATAFTLVQRPPTPSAAISVTVKRHKETDDRLTFQYALGADTSLSDMVIRGVLSKQSAANRVPRGENASRTLQHVGVVVEMIQVSPTSLRGLLTVPKPKDFQKHAYTFHVLVQQQRTLDVHGATLLLLR